MQEDEALDTVVFGAVVKALDALNQVPLPFFFSSLLLSSLELVIHKVYEPQIRARLGTAAHFVFTCPSSLYHCKGSGIRGLR